MPPNPDTCFSAQSALRKLVPLADRVLVKRIEMQAKVRARVHGPSCARHPATPAHSWKRRLTQLPTFTTHSTFYYQLGQSAGGILLVDSGKKLNEGEVVAVGKGALSKDGSLLPMNVSVGDRVMLPEYGGHSVKIGEEELFLFRDEDILGKFQ